MHLSSRGGVVRYTPPGTVRGHGSGPDPRTRPWRAVDPAAAEVPGDRGSRTGRRGPGRGRPGHHQPRRLAQISSRTDMVAMRPMSTARKTGSVFLFAMTFIPITEDT